MACGDAIELLRRRIAARRTPDASLINLLGIVYLQSGRIPEAVDELRKTVKLAPGVAIYRCNLALALHKRGDSEEAIQLIDQASANDGMNAGLYNYNRCIVLAESGRIEEARQLISAAEEYAARTPLRSPLARRLREEAMARVQQLCGRSASMDQST